MLSSALVGGVLLAFIEGAGIALSHYTADNFRQVSVLERMQVYNDSQLRQEKQQQQIATFYSESPEVSCLNQSLNMFAFILFFLQGNSLPA